MDLDLQRIHNLLIQPAGFTEMSSEEEVIVFQVFQNPSVRKYLQLLYLRAMMDLFTNEADSSENLTKMAARFNKLKGIQYVSLFFLNELTLPVITEEKKGEDK